jgi:hypothetical protein
MRGRTWGTMLVLFAVAFLVRFLFWRATPDAAWAYSAWYKGDAPKWIEYARAMHAGRPFEWGLPMHPPGMAWLTAVLWPGDGAGFAAAKLAMVGLGALVPPLFFLAARRWLGFRPAVLAGAAMVPASALLVLSTSLNNETPYLVLTALGIAVLESAARRPGPVSLGAWGALSGLTCLFRVEHVLYVVFCGVFLLWFWRRGEGSRVDDGARGPRPPAEGGSPRPEAAATVPLRPAARTLALRAGFAALFFVLAILPWEVHVIRTVHRFNTQKVELDAETDEVARVVLGATKDLPWTPGARAEATKLPGFARDYWSAFVVGTVVYRGGKEIRAEDFRILDDAFGYRPEPFNPVPFLTLYGPINFYLANRPEGKGGFSREVMEIPPPLTGGRDRYPARLIAGFPPIDRLSLSYPPHLEVLNRGYAMGWRWIREHPGAWAGLVGEKLGQAWAGASLGFTGYGFPVGIGGVRKPVDLTVPRGGWGVTVWRLLVLVAAAAGVAAGRRLAAILPWVLFLAAKAVTVVLFFGYARIGATLVPVLFVLAAVAADRWLLARVPRPERWATAAAGAILLAAIAVEILRFAAPPEVYIRSRRVGPTDPYPEKLYIEQFVSTRRG